LWGEKDKRRDFDPREELCEAKGHFQRGVELFARGTLKTQGGETAVVSDFTSGMNRKASSPSS